QAEDGIRDFHVTGVQTCALPIYQGQVHARQDVQEVRQGQDVQDGQADRPIAALHDGGTREERLAGAAVVVPSKGWAVSPYCGQRSEERRVGKAWSERGRADGERK